MPNKSSLTLILAMCATVLFWGSAFVEIRVGLHGLGGGELALLRYMVASLVIYLLYRRIPNRAAVPRSDIPKLFGLGLLGIAVYNIALNYGEVHVAAGPTSFIVSQIPVGMTLIAYFYLGERMSRLAWMGLLVSFIGVLVIMLADGGIQHFNHGMLIILISTVSASFYQTLQKPLLQRYSAIEFTAYAIWSGTLGMIFYLPSLCRQITMAPVPATLAGIYLGIFPAVIAYSCFSYVLSRMPAYRAASILYLMPVVATLLAWVLLGEQPKLLTLVGGALALAGTMLVNWGRIEK